MNAESISSLPSAFNSFTSENLISCMNLNSSTPSSLSGDEGSECSHTIPSSLINDQCQLILGLNAAIPELKEAQKRCKELILNSEKCSHERKWLVRHLIELRYRIKELEDAIEDPNEESPNTEVIRGHHFTVRNLATARQYCDHCTEMIWSVASYHCSDCGFIVHHKCVHNVVRICAHVITSEKKYPIEEICPEIGLAAQTYKCPECRRRLDFNQDRKVFCFGKHSNRGSWKEPRLCDYSGLYYCYTCHWNNTSIVPARVIHNWDFTLRKVSRTSLQQINLLLDKPVIKLEQSNPKLFVFLPKLSIVKKIRENLTLMRKYLSECRIACEKKILEAQIGTKRHLIQSSEYYSVSDLDQIKSGHLIEFLNKIFDVFNKHIRTCEICSGKGYICEICSNDEIIYPFDDGCIPCDKCFTIYHRACWTKKMMTCPRCLRIEKRKSEVACEQEETNQN